MHCDCDPFAAMHQLAWKLEHENHVEASHNGQFRVQPWQPVVIVEGRLGVQRLVVALLGTQLRAGR